MLNKILISNFNAVEVNDTLIYDACWIAKVFKNFFSTSSAESLLKLLNPPDKYNSESVINYYSSFTTAEDISLNKTSENKVSKII